VEEQPGDFVRFVRWVTGARGEEQGRVLLCFLALLCLLVSYYLIKPLRNSQFLKEYDPDFLPVVTFGVVLLSFAVTKLFGYLADRVEKYRLVTYTYLTIMVIKIAFTWLLMYGGKEAVLAFYFFASVYFLLAIATMWACTNDIFTPQQSERCYGFIAVGSTIGGILGSYLSGLLSKSVWRDYAAIASALCMGLALALILLAARRRRRERCSEEEASPAEAPPKGQFWSDLQEILRRPYVRRIGSMVIMLAIFSSSLDYISQTAIDEGIAQDQYATVFPYLSASDYPTIYELKRKPATEREAVLKELSVQARQPADKVIQDYRRYQDGREGETRAFFSDVFLYQGLCGVVLLLVVARIVLTYFGVRFATVVMPILAAFVVLAFTFPLGLAAIQALMVIAGAGNYSLNNAAKEVLYTASDESTKFKYKPLIEGPGMRLGDVIAATLALSLEHLSRALGWGHDAHLYVLLAIVMAAVVVWLRSAYLAGLEYDKERRHTQGRQSDAADFS
jgi:AAA family ATP:ADP antiporter